MNNISKFIQIDEEGFFQMGDLRVTDDGFGHSLFQNLNFSENGHFQTVTEGEPIIVESFDQPFIAQQVYKKEGPLWTLLLAYDFKVDFDLSTITVDDWDRFHGRAVNGIPFVMSRKAQAEFFNLVDDFDDDSFIVSGKNYPTPYWINTNPEATDNRFWSDLYNSDEGPPWDLKIPHPAIEACLQQIKPMKSRIAVLGSGTGHDAAKLAQMGHLVTAIDASEEAIQETRKNFPNLEGLKTLKSDIFQLPRELFGQFDIVFEHTLFCAIPPEKRNDLVRVWSQLLNPTGHLLGIFAVMDKPHGPPYGATEWEIKQRLKSRFRFDYWTRWKESPGKWFGKELVVYAQKNNQ